ncbi:MAG TPA: LamG domain-containing protein, partial [Chthoniobacter sp.]|nr:LamG domain-containing protein [Chthoniobacter sp.]
MKISTALLALLMGLWSAPLPAQNSFPPTAPNPFQPPSGVIHEKEMTEILGPLSQSLVAAFSMDSMENGSLVYSHPIAIARTGMPSVAPFLRAMFLGAPRFFKSGDRQCADFSTSRTSIRIHGSLGGRSEYTIAGWVNFPMIAHQAYVWDGYFDSILLVADDKLMCVHGSERLAFGEPVNLTDWHHVAVTCDGSQTSLFLDGKLHGSVPIAIQGSIMSIGAKGIGMPDVATFCGALDDTFYFNRPLTAPEIATVMTARIPMFAPSESRPQAGSPESPKPQEAAQVNPPDPFAIVASADLVKTFRNSLVFVEGKSGAGSGFLATYSNGTYLFTNAHVAAGVKGAGFKSLDGTPLQIGAGSAAVGHDVVLMQTNSSAKP